MKADTVENLAVAAVILGITALVVTMFFSAQKAKDRNREELRQIVREAVQEEFSRHYPEKK